MFWPEHMLPSEGSKYNEETKIISRKSYVFTVVNMGAPSYLLECGVPVKDTMGAKLGKVKLFIFS